MNKDKLHVLYLEDNADDIILLKHVFKNHKDLFEIDGVSTRENFEQYLNTKNPDAIISDHGLVGYSGVEALEHVRKRDPLIPFMFLSGRLGEEEAVRLIMKGANDLVLKSNMQQVPKNLLKIIEESRVIKEKHRYQQELENQTNILNTLLENMEDFVFLKNQDRKYILVNKAMSDHFGIDQNSFLNQSDEALFSGKTLTDFRKSDEYVLSKRKPIRIETRYTNTEGKKFIVETIKTPLLDKNGKIKGIVGVSRNITSKKLQEERIRRNEKLLNETEKLSLSGSFHYDAKHDRLMGSPQCFNMLGLEGLKGISLNEFIDTIHPSERKIFSENLSLAIRSKETFLMEHRIISSDKNRSAFLCRTTMNYSGDNTTFYGSIRNIEEDRRNRQAIIDAQENERKNLAAELHDDLTQKLVAANMYLMSMSKENMAMDRIKSAIDLIQSGLNETRKLTRTLSLHQYENLGLKKVLQEVIESFPTEVEINSSFSFDEQKLNEQISTSIYRVIQEALTNIMKYAQASQIDISITAEDGDLHCLVEDDGIGFDVEMETARGNGLKNMHQRIMRCNGIFKITSEPNMGTVIEISIPFN